MSVSPEKFNPEETNEKVTPEGFSVFGKPFKKLWEEGHPYAILPFLIEPKDVARYAEQLSLDAGINSVHLLISAFLSRVPDLSSKISSNDDCHNPESPWFSLNLGSNSFSRLSLYGAVALAMFGQKPETFFSALSAELTVDTLVRTFLSKDGHFGNVGLNFFSSSSSGFATFSTHEDPTFLLKSFELIFENPNFLTQLLEQNKIFLPLSICPNLEGSSEKLAVNSEEEIIKVSPKGIECGSCFLKRLVYLGPNHQLENEATNTTKIMPGDNVLVIHFNQNRDQLSMLSSGQRLRKMIEDFSNLLSMLQNPDNFLKKDNSSLSVEEINILKELNTAHLFGVSHLAEFARRMKMPVWEIETLPTLFKMIHKIDSHLVSMAFGGSKIKEERLGVFFLQAVDRKKLLNKLTIMLERLASSQ